MSTILKFTNNYQKNTVHAFLELLSATGAKHPDELNTDNLMRMAEDGDAQSMSDIIRDWTYINKYIEEKETLPKPILN